MALDTIPKQEGGKLKAVASGTLPSGQPVVVNSDGTVSVVSEASFSESLGSDVTFNAANTADIASAFDSTNNKVVVAYKDNGNSGYGHARVGTINSSNNSISWGTEVTFRSSEVQYISACFDSANGKIVIAYQDIGDGFKGKAIVGTVSGTDISFGSSVQFQSGETTWINAVYDTSTSKVVIAYRNSSGTGTAIVGTVSGTSISFGSAVSTGSGMLQGSAVYHAAAERIVVAGKANNSVANAAVGAVSGTSISFGSAVEYGTSGAQRNNNKIGYDSASEKVVVFYRDEGDGNDGKASVGTVDASDNSISFATAVTVTTDTVDKVGVQGFSSGGQIIFLYSDTDNTKGDLKVGTISGTTLSVGSELNVRNGGNTNYWGLCEDTTNDRIVIAYEGASVYGVSNVYNPNYSVTNLTSENYIGMSGGVVELEGSADQAVGSPTLFENASTDAIATTFDRASGKVVIAYADGGNSGYGTAIVGTVSGTSISFGSAVVYRSAYANNTTATYDANAEKVVISYRDLGNSGYGTSIVGTVSGTSISFGSAVVFESADVRDTGSTYDSNSQKVVVTYRDTGNSSYGTAVVGTVSGTSISFGTAVAFEASSTERIDCDYDAQNGKVVIAYQDVNNSQYCTAIVGTVSGTSISFGTAAVFDQVETQSMSVTYDETAQRTIISYNKAAPTPKAGRIVVCTVTGDSISFSTPVEFEPAEVLSVSSSYDSNAQKVITCYYDAGNSNKGTAVVFQAEYENITRGSVADGDNATVDIVGTVSSNQVSLTAGQQYYVQTDGTIGTTPADPSVLAGTAVSATKMVVKS